jgi:hypothetical protein
MKPDGGREMAEISECDRCGSEAELEEFEPKFPEPEIKRLCPYCANSTPTETISDVRVVLSQMFNVLEGRMKVICAAGS